MKIASITLISSRAKDIVADALRSVTGHVDLHIIVDLGLDDATRVAIADGLRDTDGFAYVKGIENPTAPQLAECRNIGLRYAADLGFDWALMLDTDERMVWPEGGDLRAFLAAAPAPLVLVADIDRGYAKERFIKLPMAAPYEGEVHEHIPASVPRILCNDIYFRELEKTPEQIAAGAEAVAKAIREGKNTPCPRDDMYMGAYHATKQEWGTALAYYNDAWEESEWDEQRAWARICIASIYTQMGDLVAAHNAAVAGLIDHPGCAELAWLAGRACMKLGRPLHALAWARMALANSAFVGGQQVFGRTYFSNPHGLKLGPLELLFEAHLELGHDAEAEQYGRMLEEHGYVYDPETRSLSRGA